LHGAAKNITREEAAKKLKRPMLFANNLERELRESSK